VAASFFPLYDFSRQVAGDRAEVISLVPPGVEPHDWEPSPRDVAEVRKARLFVFNGGGFEQAADRILKEIATGGPLPVDTSAGIPLLEAAAGDGPGHDKGGGHAKDPHVWLDPVLAQRQVAAIADGLTRIDPPGREIYEGNAAGYTAKLAELHRAFAAGLERCARRDIITSHAAFAYLAKRYALVQVPVMGLAPESEPSPADLARLVRFARKARVRYIFFESLVSPKLADTLAREIGAGTLVLNPVEGLTKEEAAAGKDYVALMRENLQNLRTALDCQ
jgi:zinc transport system substrate-binding protein